MTTRKWKIAGVQMDIALGDLAGNRARMLAHLRSAAAAGAELVVFPECTLNGYGFPSRAAIREHAEEYPGPSLEFFAKACSELGVHCVYGFFEKAGPKLFNACTLVGPKGPVALYRKLHLPKVGADKFTDPGDRPMQVVDIGGLKLGMHICFDGSFPETTRVLALQGADLAVLPTNWAEKAVKSATIVSPVRAFENKIYFIACNRIGSESGFRYIGRSSISDPLGDVIASAADDRETIVYAEIDTAHSREKLIVNVPDEYEVDRFHWRRPDMYGTLTAGVPFAGHNIRD